MERRDVEAALSKLQRMDQYAVRTYQHAIEKTRDAEVVRALQRFQQEHRRHAEDVREALRQERMQQRDVTIEFERLTRSLAEEVDRAQDEADVIYALRLFEQATSAEYAEALEMGLDGRSRQLLEQHSRDERRHLEFIETHVPVVAGSRMQLGARQAGTFGTRHTIGGWGTGGYGTGAQYGGGESGTQGPTQGGLGGYGSDPGRPPGGYYRTGEEASRWARYPGGTGPRRF